MIENERGHQRTLILKYESDCHEHNIYADEIAMLNNITICLVKVQQTCC